MEREHERDEFQQEIKNLEAQLKLPTKGHSTTGKKGQRVRVTLYVHTHTHRTVSVNLAGLADIGLWTVVMKAC